MQIKGIEGMDAAQIRDEIERGGRFVYFLWNISVVVLSFKRPSSIFFVKAGRSRVVRGLPYVLVSFLFGWWGFPWGLIYTPECLYKNLRGGIDVTAEVLQDLR